MKKVIVMLALVTAVSAYSQGTVNFQNKSIPYSGGLANARITYGNGNGVIGPVTAGSNVTSVAFTAGGVTWGVNAKAALYGGASGGAESAMTLLIPAVNFRSGGNAGYVNVGTSSSRTIDTLLPGAKAWVQIRAWDTGDVTDTYEAALTKLGYLGKSDIIQVTLGGGSPALPQPDLVDERTLAPIAGFSINYVPEPSIIGLGILGAVAGLFVFRRRN